MLIDLDKEQYRQLLYLITVGSWVLNDIKDESEIKFNELEQYIYSLNKEFESEDLVEYNEEDDYYYPSSQLEEEVTNIIDEFLENNCIADDDEEWDDEDFFSIN